VRSFAARTTLALLLVVAAGAPAGATVLDRASQDRPDEQLGPQVHLLYVTPADGPDRSWDTNAFIANSVATWNGWFRQHADGAALRIDTLNGETDVSFVRLGRTGQQVVAADAYYAIAGELAARGFNDRSKVYAVYYEGRSGGPCGQGSPPVAILYVAECGGPDAVALRPDAWHLAMLHEVLHALGAVPSCAPHHAGGHVNEDNRDILYSGGLDGPKDWPNLTLDPGRDDYFGHSIPGCPDLADSDLLTTRPFYRLTVTPGPGGIVTALDRVCRRDDQCSFVVRGGTDVTLVATPRSGYRFGSWSSQCGRTPTCRLKLTSTTSVTATFKKVYRLRLTVTGPGLIRTSPGNKTCRSGQTCALDGIAGTRVTLRALPSKGARLLRWQGPPCSGATCVVRLNSDRTVRVAFSR
jgi:Divergent InlB B-repeat domain